MKRFEKVFVAFCLIATSVITVATSKKDDATNLSFYVATSNCVNPNVNEVIGVSGNQIVSPSSVDFTDLGLPQPTLTIATDTTVSGTANAVTRVCTYSSNNSNGTQQHIYGCSDNNVPTCAVMFVAQ